MDGFGVLVLVVLAAIIWFGFFRRSAAPDSIETGHGGDGPHADDAGALLPARWVLPAEVILIGQVPIHGGLFYFGHTFRRPVGADSIQGPRPDAAIIDPRYPVGEMGREDSEFPLSPPFGYDMMDRRQRRQFLHWLSGPRQDTPSLDSAFVLIYFHGLERRLMIDRPTPDRELVRTEVRRLASIFGARPWFRDLPADLLNASLAAEGIPDDCPAPAPDLWAGSAIAPAALVHLGRLVARSGRLEADGALLWLLADRAQALRTPAAREFATFRTLFARRFAGMWPEGFAVPVPAERLRYHVYRSSDGAFETRFPLGNGTIPDLRPVWEEMAPLRGLADSVAADLEAHARFVASGQDRRDTPAAAALLPADFGPAVRTIPRAPEPPPRPVARTPAPTPEASTPEPAEPAMAPLRPPPVPRPVHSPALPPVDDLGPQPVAPPPVRDDRSDRPPTGPTAEPPMPLFSPPPVPAPAVAAAHPSSPAAAEPAVETAPYPWLQPPVRPERAPEARAEPERAPASGEPDGLETAFGGRSVGIVPMAGVLKAARLAPTWPLPLAALGRVLDQRDVAFEPDPRCGALPPAPEASLAFFPAEKGGPHRPAVLAAGRYLVEAVALMAGSGQVSDADFTFLDVALQAIDGPAPEERTRLWAYVAALYAAPAPGRAVAEALGRLSAGERAERIRGIRRVFPLEDARTRVCALRLAMVLDGIAGDDLG